MRKKIFLLVVALGLFLSTILSAQEQEQTAAPASEDKVSATKDSTLSDTATDKVQSTDAADQSSKIPAKLEPAPAPAPAAVPVSVPVKAMAAKIAKVVTPYGQVRLDSAFDSTRSFGGGNWVFWTLRDYHGQLGSRSFDDDSSQELNIHARNTRFGLRIGAVPLAETGAEVSGRFEIDFYGADAKVTSWKAIPRLRIGAVTVKWGDLALMAGNNWDTFSALISHGDDNGVHWWGGNLGARRPQLRLTYAPQIHDRFKLIIQAAMARSLDIAGDDYDGLGNSDFDHVGNGTNDGEDSAIPQLQWRLALEAKLWTKAPLKVGLSGHWEKGLFHNPVGSLRREQMDSYHVGAELDLPLLDVLSVRGEAYYGQALKDVMGGIAQDLNPATGAEIQAAGGWAELVVKPMPAWWIALGGSGDFPMSSSMQVDTVAQLESLRYSNSYAFLTSSYHFGNGFGVSLGYLMMRTEYHIANDASRLDAGYVSSIATNHRVISNIYFKF